MTEEQRKEFVLITGDILHFKRKDIRRFFKGFNRTKAGIFIETKHGSHVFTIEGRRVKMINFEDFKKEFNYISSHPIWKLNPLPLILKNLNKNYINSDRYIGELLQIEDWHKLKPGGVLKYCVACGLLND